MWQLHSGMIFLIVTFSSYSLFQQHFIVCNVATGLLCKFPIVPFVQWYSQSKLQVAIWQCEVKHTYSLQCSATSVVAAD